MYGFQKTSDIIEVLKKEILFKQDYDIPKIHLHCNFLELTFSCKTVSNCEANKLFGCNKDETAWDSSEGVYIPNCSVADIYSMRNPLTTSHFELSIDMINSVKAIPKNEIKLAYTIFCILHEFGHWDYFINSGMSSKTFIEFLNPYRQKIVNKENSIKALPNYDMTKKAQEREYNIEYNELPDEKAANSYALRNIALALEKVTDNIKSEMEGLSILNSILNNS
jgi:hypothetical protein